MVLTVKYLKTLIAGLPDTAKISISDMNGTYFNFEATKHGTNEGYDKSEAELELILPIYINSYDTEKV